MGLEYQKRKIYDSPPMKEKVTEENGFTELRILILNLNLHTWGFGVLGII